MTFVVCPNCSEHIPLGPHYSGPKVEDIESLKRRKLAEWEAAKSEVTPEAPPTS